MALTPETSVSVFVNEAWKFIASSLSVQAFMSAQEAAVIHLTNHAFF
ncbi:MAG: hypothetical protein V7K67_09090 [Nostoc sp.]